jgi:hypothetical protein
MDPQVESEGHVRRPPPKQSGLHCHRDDSDQPTLGACREEPMHGESFRTPVERLAAEGEAEARSLHTRPLELERLGAVGDLVVAEGDTASVSRRRFPR